MSGDYTGRRVAATTRENKGSLLGGSPWSTPSSRALYSFPPFCPRLYELHLLNLPVVLGWLVAAVKT